MLTDTDIQGLETAVAEMKNGECWVSESESVMIFKISSRPNQLVVELYAESIQFYVANTQSGRLALVTIVNKFLS